MQNIAVKAVMELINKTFLPISCNDFRAHGLITETRRSSESWLEVMGEYQGGPIWRTSRPEYIRLAEAGLMHRYDQ